MNSGSKVLLGVLAGAATGAILGVLFAPDKGEETRRRLGEGSRDLTDNLKQRFGDFVDTVAERYDTVKGSAGDLIEQGRSKVSSVLGGDSNGGSSMAGAGASGGGGRTSGGSGSTGGAGNTSGGAGNRGGSTGTGGGSSNMS